MENYMLSDYAHNGSFLMLIMLLDALAVFWMWEVSTYPAQEIINQAMIFFAAAIFLGAILVTYGLFLDGGKFKMGLFNRLGKTTKAKETPIETVTMVDPVELIRNTVALTQMMDETLKQYETMINNGHSLALSEYKGIIISFMKLAQNFEKIYELMNFDVSKLEELQKYHEKTQTKRQELMKQLESGEPLKPPQKPKTNGKQASK
jgi:hypothetical protein